MLITTDKDNTTNQPELKAKTFEQCQAGKMHGFAFNWFRKKHI